MRSSARSKRQQPEPTGNPRIVREETAMLRELKRHRRKRRLLRSLVGPRAALTRGFSQS